MPRATQVPPALLSMATALLLYGMRRIAYLEISGNMAKLAGWNAMKTKLPILLLLFCACTGVFAQNKFNGEFHLEGGNNFHNTVLNDRSYFLGGINARIGYKTEKISIDVYGNTNYNSRYIATVGKNLTVSGQDTTKKADISADKLESLSYGTGFDFNWTQSENNFFKISYSYSGDRATPQAASIVTDEIIDKKADRDVSFKETDNRFGSHKAGINYTHKFNREGRMLEAIATFKAAKNDKMSSWTIGRGEGDLSKIQEMNLSNLTIDRQYRDIPSSRDNEVIASVKYADKSPFGIKNFEWDATLLYNFRDLSDNQAMENYKESQWVDSTEVRENFRFRTARITPTLHFTYKVWKYILEASYSPEYYAHKLDSDKQTGNVNKDVVSHFFYVNNSLTPWDGHEFSLNVSRSESRPGYLEICWFPRQSAQYSNELYKGNENLLPTVYVDGYLSYKYTLKRFSTTFDVGHNYTKRKVEQTYNNEEIDGREYRIYTWINGGKSHETNGAVKLSWSGSKLSANTRFRYNYYHGVNADGDETRSGDYNISGDIEYSLKTWKFAADIAYQSGIERDYNSLGEIIKCNARISKSFGKFGVYIQGRDLFDSPIVIITKSEDGSETRYEQTRKNNRVFLLGIDWSF